MSFLFWLTIDWCAWNVDWDFRILPSFFPFCVRWMMSRGVWNLVNCFAENWTPDSPRLTDYYLLLTLFFCSSQGLDRKIPGKFDTIIFPYILKLVHFDCEIGEKFREGTIVGKGQKFKFGKGILKNILPSIYLHCPPHPPSLRCETWNIFLSSIKSKRHQPKIKLASKHERQVDLRPFPERKSLFNGVSFLLRAISPWHLMRRQSFLYQQSLIQKWLTRRWRIRNHLGEKSTTNRQFKSSTGTEFSQNLTTFFNGRSSVTTDTPIQLGSPFT